MTREEAARILDPTTPVEAHGYREIDEWNKASYRARLIAVEALLKPPSLMREPDPETGLVLCGCGEKPVLMSECVPPGFRIWWVDCKCCDVMTLKYGSSKEAIDQWNKAMGWKGEQ